jgi:hypothetical protein
MTTIRLDGSWDDARDGAFFTLTARLFPPAFCAGAGVLLASYDDLQSPAAPAPHVVRRDVRSTAASRSPSRARGA